MPCSWSAAATYHPGVASASVDQPPCNLANSLDNQQCAEPFEELEDRACVSQHIIPNAQHYCLHHAVLAKQPLSPACAFRLEDPAESPFYPTGAPRIDGKLSQRPNEQRRDNNPLCQAEEGSHGPAHARLFGGYEADGRVEEVEDGERQAVG